MPAIDGSAPFISELIRAANEVHRLTGIERARLLRRAASTIHDYRFQIAFFKTPANDPGKGEIVHDLHAMADTINAFTSHEVSALLLDSAEVIRACRILQNANPEAGPSE